jgi:thiol-disulfide isomerase/thioredoxin
LVAVLDTARGVVRVRTRELVVLLGVVQMAAIVASHAGPRTPRVAPRTFAGGVAAAQQTGQPAAAPEVRVVDLKGLDAVLAAYHGKPILVNFWAIWCQPCVEELPEFLQTAREARVQGAVGVTVSYDLMIPEVTKEGVLNQMRDYVASHHIDAPVLIYDADDYDAINARFGLPGPVPVTIALDKNGTVVDRFAGKGDKVKFDAMLRKARGE